jgi:hypothetical protein
VVALAAAAAVLSTPAVVRAGTWADPVTAIPAGDGSTVSQTVSLGLGGLVSVDQQLLTHGPEIVARFASPGGDFGPAQLLGGQGSFYPTVESDAAGEAIAAWWNEDDFGLHVAISPAGQPFGPATVLASTSVGYSAEAPHLAVNTSGDAVVLYVGSTDGQQRVFASYRPAGGDFGPGEVVAPASDDPGGQLPRSVAINDLGDVVAGYLEDGVAHVAIRSPGPDGTWQPPQALGGATGGYSWRLPVVGIDSVGGAVAVWEEGGDNTNQAVTIEAAFRAPGGMFGAPESLGIEASDNEEPQLGVSALGEVILLARPVVQEVGGVGLEPLVVFSGSTGSGAFAPPVEIGAPLLAFDEQLAMNAVGDAIVTYDTCCDNDADRLVALRRGPLGSFGPAEDIVPPYPVPPGQAVYSRSTVDTRLDPFGNAVVSWVDASPAPAGASAPAMPLLVSTDSVLQSTLGTLTGLIESVPAELIQSVAGAVAGLTGGTGTTGTTSVSGIVNGALGPPVGGPGQAGTGGSVPSPIRAVAPLLIRRPVHRPASGLAVAIRRGRGGGPARFSVRISCPATCTVSFAASLDRHPGRTIPLRLARTRLTGAARASVPVSLTPSDRRAIAHDGTSLRITARAVNAAGEVAFARARRTL